MLAAQVVQLPFSGGLDEKTQPELVEPGAFLTLSNLLHTKGGSLTKPFGLTALANTTFGSGIAAGKRLFGRQDEICLIDGHWLFSYSATAQTWFPMGRIPECVVGSRQQLAGITTFPSDYVVATANGYLIAVYGTLGGYRCTVRDLANGATLACPDAVLNTPKRITNLRIGAVGNTVVIVGIGVDTSSEIVAHTLNVSNPAGITTGWSAETLLASDNQTGGNFQFDVAYGASQFYLAYENNAASNNRITVTTFSSALTQNGTTQLNTLADLDFAIGCGVGPDGSGNEMLWLAYRTQSDQHVYGFALSSALAVTGTKGTLITPDNAGERPTMLGWVPTANGQATLVAGDDATNTAHSLYYVGCFISGGVTTSGYNALQSQSFPQQRRYRLHLASQPFAMGGRFYVMARYQKVSATVSSTENQLACVDVTGNGNTTYTSIRPIAWVAPRLSMQGTSPGAEGHQRPVIVGNKVYFLHVVARAGASVVSSINYNWQTASAGLELVGLDFADSNRWQPAQLGQLVLMSGGVPSYYDGKRVAELGFFVPPTVVSSSTMAGAGLNGTYQYVAVYEQSDGTGQYHRSAPSVPFTVATGGAVASITVNITTLQVTMRIDLDSSEAGRNPPRIAIYRTVAGGSTFYRVGYMTNDATVDTLAFIDSATDGTVSAQELLYTQPGTQGGAQFRVPPSSFRGLVVHQDRVIGIGDDGVSLWPSGAHVIGEGPWFADTFQIPIEAGGPITALGSMDGRHIVYKRNAIAIIDGSGPPDAGGPGFSDAQYISTQIGCIEPRSVVVTSMGTFFQSLRGIELLTRGMSVEGFFGRDVEAEEVLYPITTSATMSEGEGKVYFTCIASEGSASGEILLYDMVFGSWSVLPLAAQSSAAIGASPGVMPIMSFLAASGSAFQQNKATYLSSLGAFQPSVMETPWIKMAGLQGYQRVRRAVLLANAATGHDITVSLAFNFNGTYVKSETFTAAQIAALPREELSLQIPAAYAKSQAIRIKVADATPSSGALGTGQGPILLGLALEIGVKKGIRRLGATAKA